MVKTMNETELTMTMLLRLTFEELDEMIEYAEQNNSPISNHLRAARDAKRIGMKRFKNGVYVK